jgi:hypothetical protein
MKNEQNIKSKSVGADENINELQENVPYTNREWTGAGKPNLFVSNNEPNTLLVPLIGCQKH